MKNKGFVRSHSNPHMRQPTNVELLGKSSFPLFQHCAGKYGLRWFCGGIHCLVESKTAEDMCQGDLEVIRKKQGACEVP